MGIIKFDKDEFNKLLNKAKDKATDLIGEEGVNTITEIKKSVVEAGSEIKETIKENYGDKFDEIKEDLKENYGDTFNSVKNVIKEGTDQIKEKGAVNTAKEYFNNVVEEKKEEERQQQLEIQKKQEEERIRKSIQKKKTESWFKKNKLLVIVIILGVLVLGGFGTLLTSINENKGKISIGYSNSNLVGQNYETVNRLLSEQGFTNIELKEEKDISVDWLYKEGEVAEVIIDYKTDYNEKTKVDPSSKVIIKYHSPVEIEEETEPEVTEPVIVTEENENTDVEEVVVDNVEENVNTTTIDEPDVIDVTNNADWNEIMTTAWPEDNEELFKKMKSFVGKTVKFDGYVAWHTKNYDYDYIFNYYFRGGDNDDTCVGPQFALEDIPYAGFHFKGSNKPESVEDGLKVTMTFKISRIEDFYFTGRAVATYVR